MFKPCLNQNQKLFVHLTQRTFDFMEITSEIILFTSKTNKDGTHPICLRVTYNRKPKYISVANVKFEDWDPEEKQVLNTNKKYKDINRDIKSKDAEAEDLVLDFNRGKSRFTPDQIVKKLRGEPTSETFFDFLAEMAEEYKARNKYDDASSIESKGKNIWSFVNGGKEFPIKPTNEIKFSKPSILRQRSGNDLSFSEITPTFLRKLDTFIGTEKGLSKRYVFNHMNIIQNVYNRGNGIDFSPNKKDPFEEYTMSKPKSQKVGLEQEEVASLQAAVVQARTDTWIHAKNAWLFAFAFAGQRISDALTVHWSKFDNGKIRYIMRKNGKPVELPIPEMAQVVLDYYLPFKDQNQGYVFPALKNANLNDPIDFQRKIKTAVKQYNKWLKPLAKAAKVKKNLTTHLSRHTFGKIAGDKIPMSILQIYYNHSDIQTTSGYQQDWINQEQLDKHLTTIVDFTKANALPPVSDATGTNG